MSSTVINNVDIFSSVVFQNQMLSYPGFNSAQKLAQAIETFSINTGSHMGAHKLKMIMCCTIFLSGKVLNRLG